MSAEHPDTDWLQLTFEFDNSERADLPPAFFAAASSVSATIYQLPRRPTSIDGAEANAIQRLLEKAEALPW